MFLEVFSHELAIERDTTDRMWKTWVESDGTRMLIVGVLRIYISMA